MRRIHSLLLVLLVQCSLVMAEKIGEWQVYPSYWIATQNVTAGTCVYGLMNGNLLRYDTEDTSVKLYDCLNDLNDVSITHIRYSKEAKKLILTYSNGNIDLLDLEDNVTNIASLKDSKLAKKDITGVGIDGYTAYVATGFGYITIDMKEGVIRQTIKGEKIPSGIDTQPQEYNLAGGYYWHSDGMNGLRGYKYENGKYVLVPEMKIQPNSPVRDLFYRMHYEGDRLLVAGGSANYSGIDNPGTAMYFENDTWTNFDDGYLTDENLNEKYPRITHYNFTDIVQSPSDSTIYYCGSFRNGLYKFQNGKYQGLFNCDNSHIRSILPNDTYYYLYCPAMGLQYDADGNLWMLNAETDTIIRYMSPQGKWGALPYTDIAGTPTPTDYLFTSSGVNFVISQRMTNRGFFGFYTNETLANTHDDYHLLRSKITNEDGTSYSPNQFYCMTEDLDGAVWCGTNDGLFVIDDPATFFDDDFTFNQIKIARNDGSGLADYLLNGVVISCIAVDGANRKWIGTYGNGLYLVSADGEEMIHHFQADDSPLLSDNINCLAIQPSTGLVMIGTDAGLCSYMSDAKESEETLDKDNVLAYPNPVRPEYTGPITVDGLTRDSEVKICSSTGQLIWSGTSNGGRFVWDGCNKQGRRVASGVYNVIANNAAGKKAIVTHIMVIR